MTQTAASGSAGTGTGSTGSEWQRGEVRANGIKIHYYRTGGDKPPLVLLHGATDNGLCWTPVAKALQADYDIVMPDSRGHGLSDAPESGYGTVERAADLAGMIEALKLERPALGGHSMGGSTALRFVAEYPDVARCAFLEDPGLRSAPPPGAEAEQESRRERMRRSAAENKALGRDGLIARIRAQHPEWGEDEYEPWADSKLQVSEQFTTAVRFPDRPDWRELLPRIKCPLLLITADPEKGGIVTPEMAAEAQQLLPRLEVVRIHGAGHSVRRERFQPFLEAVRSFLAAH